MSGFGIDLTGSRIDDFLVRRMLGSGGCATVSLADEQGTTFSKLCKVVLIVTLADQSDCPSFLSAEKCFSQDIAGLARLSQEPPIVADHHSFSYDIYSLTDGGIVEELGLWLLKLEATILPKNESIDHRTCIHNDILGVLLNIGKKVEVVFSDACQLAFHLVPQFWLHQLPKRTHA